MDSDDEDEEKEAVKGPKFPIEMFITEGNKYLRLLQYIKAIEFFEQALEWEPTNQRSLLGRAKCQMRLANYVEAKQDALEVLKAHPKNSEAKYLIGEAEYFLGDFEKSFLTFYRAYSVRPDHEGLRLGHQMCRKAIDNALQPDKTIIIGDRDVANLVELKSEVKEVKDSDRRRVAKDAFSVHLDFVRKLLEDEEIESIHPECRYLLKYMTERQVFWKTQKPKTGDRYETQNLRAKGRGRVEDSETDESWYPETDETEYPETDETEYPETDETEYPESDEIEDPETEESYTTEDPETDETEDPETIEDQETEENDTTKDPETEKIEDPEAKEKDKTDDPETEEKYATEDPETEEINAKENPDSEVKNDA